MLTSAPVYAIKISIFFIKNAHARAHACVQTYSQLQRQEDYKMCVKYIYQDWLLTHTRARAQHRLFAVCVSLLSIICVQKTVHHEGRWSHLFVGT